MSGNLPISNIMTLIWHRLVLLSVPRFRLVVIIQNDTPNSLYATNLPYVRRAYFEPEHQSLLIKEVWENAQGHWKRSTNGTGK